MRAFNSSMKFYCFTPWRAIIAVMATVLLSFTGELRGAETKPEAEWDIDSVRAKGKEIVKEAAEKLSLNLMHAITHGGFTNAIEFCSVHAEPLTAGVVTDQTILLRRVSFQTRNPENKPDEFEAKLLKHYAEDIRAGRIPTPQIETTKDQARYFEPIVISNPLCLNCHGVPHTQVKEDTLRIINKLYPKDGATGYKMGELRGLWSVTFREKTQESKKAAP